MVRRLIWCKNLSCKPSSCCRWLFGSFHLCELSPGTLSRSAPSSEKLAGSTGELTSFVHPSALLGQDKPGEMLSPAEKPIRIDKEELGLLPPGGASPSPPRGGGTPFALWVCLTKPEQQEADFVRLDSSHFLLV